jgi:Na+/H+ antiporter NhaC
VLLLFVCSFPSILVFCVLLLFVINNSTQNTNIEGKLQTNNNSTQNTNVEGKLQTNNNSTQNTNIEGKLQTINYISILCTVIICL